MEVREPTYHHIYSKSRKNDVKQVTNGILILIARSALYGANDINQLVHFYKAHTIFLRQKKQIRVPNKTFEETNYKTKKKVRRNDIQGKPL